MSKNVAGNVATRKSAIPTISALSTKTSVLLIQQRPPSGPVEGPGGTLARTIGALLSGTADLERPQILFAGHLNCSPGWPAMAAEEPLSLGAGHRGPPADRWQTSGWLPRRLTEPKPRPSARPPAAPGSTGSPRSSSNRRSAPPCPGSSAPSISINWGFSQCRRRVRLVFPSPDRRRCCRSRRTALQRRARAGPRYR